MKGKNSEMDNKKGDAAEIDSTQREEGKGKREGTICSTLTTLTTLQEAVNRVGLKRRMKKQNERIRTVTFFPIPW